MIAKAQVVRIHQVNDGDQVSASEVEYPEPGRETVKGDGETEGTEPGPEVEAGAHKAMEPGLGRRRRDWGGRMGLDSRKSDKCSNKSVRCAAGEGVGD